MCPACIATAAWIATGTASAGGLTVFAVTKFHKNGKEKRTKSKQKEK